MVRKAWRWRTSETFLRRIARRACIGAAQGVVVWRLWGKMMPFEELALVVVLASVVCLFALLLWERHAPLRIAVADPLQSGRASLKAGIADPSSLHRVGKLVTALMLAQDGWKQLSSRSIGAEGSDGLFVRKVAGRNRFEARIVETRCSPGEVSASDYDPETMADDKVIERLESMKGGAFENEPDMDDQAIDAIIKAIKRRSVHVTKQLYAHALGSGTTAVYTVGRNGQLIERPAAKVARVAGVPHQLMLRTLAAGLARLNAGGEPSPGDLTAAAG
jgi:hypothetical protein